ncbi:MAG: RnfABCDGE type electron transport complex subunit D [Pirellulaceae bacterium]
MTGLLLGLTLSASTPVYMILVGVLVAQIPGKVRFKRWKRNLFNPAALGPHGRRRSGIYRSLCACRMEQGGRRHRASALFKDAGGNLRPAMSDVFLGFTRGAIGETSDLILISVGILMLWLVVVKRDAPLAMIFSVLLLVLALPTGADVVGHARGS